MFWGRGWRPGKRDGGDGEGEREEGREGVLEGYMVLEGMVWWVGWREVWCHMSGGDTMGVKLRREEKKGKRLKEREKERTEDARRGERKEERSQRFVSVKKRRGEKEKGKGKERFKVPGRIKTKELISERKKQKKVEGLCLKRRKDLERKEREEKREIDSC